MLEVVTLVIEIAEGRIMLSLEKDINSQETILRYLKRHFSIPDPGKKECLP